MATSHQNVTSIIYKQDNGSFYLLNNTRGLVVGNESMSLIRNMLIEQSSYFKISGFVNKFFWQVRVGDRWIYDDRLHIAIAKSKCVYSVMCIHVMSFLFLNLVDN